MKKKRFILLACTFMFIFSGCIHVNAITIDEVISSKKVTLKVAKPSTEDEIYTVMDIFSGMYPGYHLQDCSEDGTSCDVYTNGNMGPGEKQATVTIEYDYDPAIKKVADGFLKKMGTEEKVFYMNDIEGINYFYANHDYIGAHPELAQDPEFDGIFALTLPSFSSELKQYFEYSNFDVRVGLGTDDPYYQAQGGNIEFWYNGTLYGVGPRTVVVMPFIVYIPEDATNIEKAIKDRLGAYFEVDTVEKDTTKTITAIIAEKRTEAEDNWDHMTDSEKQHCGYATKEAYVEARLNMQIYNEEAEAHFLTKAIDDRYVVTFKDGWATALVVVKDNTQASDTRKVVTNDTGTGVEISTEGIIPLDTLIQVAKVTSGEEYDKIVKLLKVNDVEMFDLKLYSKSEGDFITKLTSGKFQVKLPVSEKFKDKTSFIVYYVDENDKVIEYEAKLDDTKKFVVFETDHFSIYTLALKETATSTTEEVPKTSDLVILHAIVCGLSTIGIMSLSLYKKKTFNI